MAYKYKKKKLYLGRIVGRQGDLNGGHSWKVLKLILHDYFYPMDLDVGVTFILA